MLKIPKANIRSWVSASWGGSMMLPSLLVVSDQWAFVNWTKRSIAVLWNTQRALSFEWIANIRSQHWCLRHRMTTRASVLSNRTNTHLMVQCVWIKRRWCNLRLYFERGHEVRWFCCTERWANSDSILQQRKNYLNRYCQSRFVGKRMLSTSFQFRRLLRNVQDIFWMRINI